MNRNVGTIALCLGLGAAVMYGSTNFRIEVKPVAGPEAKVQPTIPPGAEPGRLPDDVSAKAPAAEPPRRDPRVRPAGAFLADPGAPAPIRITSVADADGKVKWLPTALPTGAIPAISTKLTLALDRKLKPGDGMGKGREDLSFSVGGDDKRFAIDTADPDKVGAIRADTGGVTTVTLDLSVLAANKMTQALDIQLWVSTDVVQANVPQPVFADNPPRLTVLVPTPSTNARRVEITNQQNSPYMPRDSAAGVVNVYGKPQFEPYLRLYGTVLDVAGSFKYVLQPMSKDGNTPDGTAYEVRGDPELRGASDAWNAVVNLPVLANGARADLYVRAESASARVYAADPIKLQFNYIPETLDKPTLTVPPAPTADESRATRSVNQTRAPSPFSSPDLPAYYANANKYDIAVTSAPAEAQGLVLFVDDTTPKFPGVLPTQANPKFAGVELGAGRDHVIGVAAVRGKFIGSVAQVKLLVEREPPVVESVTTAPAFGTPPGPDKIVIRFNSRNPITAASANKANFTIVHNENPTRAGAPALAITSVTPDPVANTVTLNVTGIIPGTYTVGIKKAAVTDVFGNVLPESGEVTGATTAFEYVVSTQGAGPDAAATLPSQRVGITHQTGPPVEFPEYAPFRVSKDGFNPADRVESRVMRLYYYRDAHRVAQLINRTVKSYNAATVEITRRVADSVRDKADAATDERKTLENRAVRAAQEARAAEADLANAQSSVNTARNQGATARIDLIQRQQELEQAIRERDRALALAPGRTNNDAALEAQRPVVEVERRELARIDEAIKLATTDPERAELRLRRLDQANRLATEQRTFDRLLAENQTRTAAGTDPAQLRVTALEAEIKKLQSVSLTADLTERSSADRIAAAQSAVAGKREVEAKAVESWQVKEFQERRLREDQFRREVAAAREDPDTYAPAKLDSMDPVMQVSVSVIGEGLIQLRGPIKGLNVIRTMVNQIDAPVGQVRVSVHTLQVNGERADRMEKVIANIQRYLDHSRFLTAQSSQMLRNAVTLVASRKATEAVAFAPGCSQAERDQRYLYAFFGKDFTDELAQLDSEFLKTGNKLLSLHSMDSTSLSAGLFLMALAKNDVRTEIIAEFQAMMQRDLPQAELNYYVDGISRPKHCDACKDKREYLLALNSKFQSFIGFFNTQVTGTDTLNPLQREFIKLAQIFKARMITEMQLSQRVKERALLEERVGTEYLTELKKAKEFEDQAKEVLRNAQDAAVQTQADVANQFQTLLNALTEVETGLDALKVPRVLTVFRQEAAKRRAYLENACAVKPATSTDDLVQFAFTSPVFGDRLLHYKIRLVTAADPKTPEVQMILDKEWNVLLDTGAQQIKTQLAQFEFQGSLAADAKAVIELLNRVKTIDPPEIVFTLGELEAFDEQTTRLMRSVSQETAAAKRAIDEIVAQLLAGNDDAVRKSLDAYAALKARLRQGVRPGTGTEKSAKAVFAGIDDKMRELLQVNARYQAALRKAQQARRPLDEKKLLDMLVDEMEDKFVEILEGTRAHTANIDNYMKSVTTALDDDFNTQYYLPSFARARGASRAWDVTLSQIETTSVLTNNRALGKVSPAASFEFDLPKRDILITEGFKSAKALFDEYGALMNDPSFLALSKMYSGNPVSMMQNGGGGLSSVRNVLPGLPTSADEKILAQAGPGQKQFGSALDGLIPDPAIYKFETGTGYEIRPVLSPDGQAVVFNFNYMYTTNVREPVRADEKHLGRVNRHFVNTDVQLGNFELREVSKYQVAIKVARTAKGVQLLQDIPGVGVLFRPLPSAASSLQQNLIYSQATIFPTLFDLMGLRYAPAVADLDPLADRMGEFAARYRRLDLEQRIYDIGATRVDEAIRTPYGERRSDLYRPQVTIPFRHPNGYSGAGLRLHDGALREGYDPNVSFPDTQFSPGMSPEGRMKPYNANPQYGPPGFDAPYTIPQLPPGAPYHTIPGAPPVTYPPAPGVPPSLSVIPGLPAGPVNVGKSVPYTPALPTGGAARPTELPGTKLPPTVTPGAATYQPPALTPLPGLSPRPQPPAALPTLTPPAGR